MLAGVTEDPEGDIQKRKISFKEKDCFLYRIKRCYGIK